MAMKTRLSMTAMALTLCCRNVAVRGFLLSQPSFVVIRPTIGLAPRAAGRYTTTSTPTHPAGTRQQPSVSPTHEAREGSTRTSTVSGNRMILRPDWERDGKVFGLSPQALKDKNKAAELAQGLLQQGEKKNERAFEYLVNYPCDFVIKVIGLNQQNFANDIATTVSTACEVETEDVRYTVRETNSGKYQSVTVHAPVKSAQMLYRCYELISEDPRVKFKF